MDKFNIPILNYDYKALEPHICEEIMTIHYTKHHMGYVNNLNNLLELNGKYNDHDLLQILLEKNAPQNILDNAGGHYNHSLFWAIMNPISNKEDIGSELLSAINKQYGSLERLIELFSESAMKVFGSGWVWLVMNNNRLCIVDTKNQESPFMYNMGIPILCLDVWEHAYYLQYKNERKKYVNAWWNVVDWKNVNNLFNKFALKGINVEVRKNGYIDMME